MDMENMDPDSMDVSEFAFPFARQAGFEQNGMTIKDYFAAKALQGLISQTYLTIQFEEKKIQPEETIYIERTNRRIAKMSYEIANAMLKERNTWQ